MAGFGGSVKLTGESEYRKALKSITDNLTVLSSEMKVVNSLYDKNDTSTEKLAKQNEVLSKKLDEQNNKLAEAKKMLDQAKNSTDSNAQTVAKWQNEVNKAQAEVNKTSKEIKDNTAQIARNEEALDDASDELQDFTENEDKAGQGAIKMGDLIKANLISETIMSGIKKLGSLMVDLGKKAVEVGKQAIASYADYEQLIGGVETLFKDSSGIVEGYANNAYKTAGLSANEYMTTVTSFTASLLQSLNGDTAKSAEVANMAITDMSDNANKMGTSMEMIQNAYQGFAKQNYTMLDNLKLGYGGTKGEMERLLADATAISGIEYDISNLNDVFQAIHVIQGELGITGTTAKEASTTISGSISSMKSAWSNMLTGIADDNADFGALVGNLVDSIMTVADNLLPRIQTAISGIGELVSGVLTSLAPEILNAIPPLVESLLPALIASVETITNSISATLPLLAEALSAVLPLLLNALANMFPATVDAGIKVIVSLVEGIGMSLPTLIPTVIQAIITIVHTILDNIDAIIDAGIQLIMGLVEGLVEAIPILVDAIPLIIDKIVDVFFRNHVKLTLAGIDLLIAVGAGILQALPSIIMLIPSLIGSIFNAFWEWIKTFPQIGVGILQGIWNGIVSWTGQLFSSIADLGNRILGKFKSIFGIHSPSKVFADEIGKNMAMGVGEGFENTMSGVSEQMASAIPTDFDINTNTTVGAGGTSYSFGNLVEAFKQALKEVNIVLDDEVAGRFVVDTVERVVYN